MCFFSLSRALWVSVSLYVCVESVEFFCVVLGVIVWLVYGLFVVFMCCLCVCLCVRSLECVCVFLMFLCICVCVFVLVPFVCLFVFIRVCEFYLCVLFSFVLVYV